MTLIGSPLPAANIIGDINMSATTGKVALVNNFDPLEGTCPLGDVNIVDFVGYGTGANCAETANAPAPSNTTAIFSKNGGATITITIKTTSLRPFRIHGAPHRSWRLVRRYSVAILAITAQCAARCECHS